MVKRIKKRIPKADAPETEVMDDEDGTDAAEGEGDEGPAPEPVADGLASTADDGFTQKTAGMFQWFIQNKKLLIGVAVVAIGGVSVWSFMQRNQAKADAEASTAFLSAAEAAAKANPLAPPANGAEALTGDARRGQLEKARTLFASARDSYASRPVSTLAQLGFAGVQLDLGESADAAAQYDTYLAKTKGDLFSQAVALQGKSVALENQGKTADAIKALEALKALDEKTFGIFAELEIGRLMEASGDATGARTRYRTLAEKRAAELDEMSNREAKAEIEKRIARLGEAG